jgi:preprotein translocase subunit SecG
MTIDASGYILILLGIGISYLAVSKKNILIAVLASAIWLILMIFLQSNPIAGFTAGSSGDRVTTIVLLGLMIGIPLTSWSFWRQAKKYNERDETEWHNKEDERKARKKPTYSDITDTSNNVDLMNLSDKDYMDILQGQKKKR